MSEISVTVVNKRVDKRNFIDIRFPKEQELIGVEYATMTLAAGISLLIKAGHKRGDIKDYELLEKVIEYMRSEFVSTDSFEDCVVLPGTLKKE